MKFQIASDVLLGILCLQNVYVYMYLRQFDVNIILAALKIVIDMALSCVGTAKFHFQLLQSYSAIYLLYCIMLRMKSGMRDQDKSFFFLLFSYSYCCLKKKIHFNNFQASETSHMTCRYHYPLLGERKIKIQHRMLCENQIRK